MPFIALKQTRFVTTSISINLLLASLSSIIAISIALSTPQAQAEVVLELNSAESRVKSTGHTSAIYADKNSDKRKRNPMLPRIMSQAAKRERKTIHVVASDDSIDFLKTRTAITEFDHLVSPQTYKNTQINWIARSKFKFTEGMNQYWILPFGNPERSLENANVQDIKWSIETLETTLERLLNLRYDGIEASIVLDIKDGGLPATLGHWVMDNINVHLIDDGYDPVDILLEAPTANGVKLGHHDHPTIANLMTPRLLETKFPEQTSLLIDLVHTYVDKIKFAQQKTNSCDLILRSQVSLKNSSAK